MQHIYWHVFLQTKRKTMFLKDGCRCWDAFVVAPINLVAYQFHFFFFLTKLSNRLHSRSSGEQNRLLWDVVVSFFILYLWHCLKEKQTKLCLSVLCTFPRVLAWWKTVRRVRPQRSQVSLRVALCMVVNSFFLCWYKISVCAHVNSSSLLSTSWKPPDARAKAQKSPFSVD